MLCVLHATEPPTEQKKDAVREQAWRGRQWETNEAKQEQSSLGAPVMRSDQARVASSREDTGGLGGRDQSAHCFGAFFTLGAPLCIGANFTPGVPLCFDANFLLSQRAEPDSPTTLSLWYTTILAPILA